MRVLAVLPVVAAVTSTHDKIESMKATLRSVAAGEINDETKATIQAFMNTMNSTLRGALVNEAADHQAIMNAIKGSVEGCSTARTTAFSGTVATKKGLRDTARKNHMQCKICQDSCPGSSPQLLQWPTSHNYTYDVTRNWGQESDSSLPYTWSDAVYDTADSHHAAQVAKATCGGDIEGEKGAWQAQDSSCTTLDNLAKNLWSDLVAQPDFCNEYSKAAKPGADAYHHNTDPGEREYYSWEADADKVTDPVYSWFKDMDDEEQEHRSDYKTKRDDCHEKRNIHMHKAKECHSLQGTFERKYCDWTNAIDTACYVYEGCYRSNYYSWETQKGITEGVEAQLKLQQAALECALCYGNQILQDSTNLDACDRAVGCQNCDELTIDYEAPHTFISCTEEQTVKPCGDSWKNQEYSCLNVVNEHWLPDDCLNGNSVCEAASKPDWPTNATEYTLPVAEGR